MSHLLHVDSSIRPIEQSRSRKLSKRHADAWRATGGGYGEARHATAGTTAMIPLDLGHAADLSFAAAEALVDAEFATAVV